MKYKVFVFFLCFSFILFGFSLPTEKRGVYYGDFARESGDNLTVYFTINDNQCFCVEKGTLFNISESVAYGYSTEGKIIFEPFSKPYFVGSDGLIVSEFLYTELLNDNLPRKKADNYDQFIMFSLSGLLLASLFIMFRGR